LTITRTPAQAPPPPPPLVPDYKTSWFQKEDIRVQNFKLRRNVICPNLFKIYFLFHLDFG